MARSPSKHRKKRPFSADWGKAGQRVALAKKNATRANVGRRKPVFSGAAHQKPAREPFFTAIASLSAFCSLLRSRSGLHEFALLCTFLRFRTGRQGGRTQTASPNTLRAKSSRQRRRTQNRCLSDMRRESRYNKSFDRYVAGISGCPIVITGVAAPVEPVNRPASIAL